MQFSRLPTTCIHGSNDIYSVDWGVFNSLRLLDRGTHRIHEVCHTLRKDALDEVDKKFVLGMLSSSDHLIVSHTTPFEVFKGVNARLATIAEEAGYQQKAITTIDHRNGRPVFEVFRFDKIIREQCARKP